MVLFEECYVVLFEECYVVLFEECYVVLFEECYVVLFEECYVVLFEECYVVLFECCVHIIDLHPMEYAFWTGVKCSYPYPGGLYNSGSGGLYNSYLWSVYLMSGGMLYSEFHR